MLFLYISAFLTIVLIVLFIMSFRKPKTVVRKVIVRESPDVYWLPWAWGWGGGASHVVRPQPHFAGISTQHAQRRMRRDLN
jgi:hypothetical protein